MVCTKQKYDFQIVYRASYLMIDMPYFSGWSNLAIPQLFVEIGKIYYMLMSYC